MLWIWQLSHLGDSEARLFSLGSEARLVMSHFLLVLPVVGFAPNSSTAIHHRRNSWNSSCCSVCCRSSGVIERTLYKQEKKVPKIIFWPLIILKLERLPWHWEAFLVQVSNELDLSVKSYMDMVEYTTVYRADTLDPMFC